MSKRFRTAKIGGIKGVIGEVTCDTVFGKKTHPAVLYGDWAIRRTFFFSESDGYRVIHRATGLAAGNYSLDTETLARSLVAALLPAPSFKRASAKKAIARVAKLYYAWAKKTELP